METTQLLNQAAAASGGVSGLATKLGITNKAVYQWKKRGIPIAWQRVIKAEILKRKRTKPTEEVTNG